VIKKAPSFGYFAGALGFNGQNLIIEQLGPEFSGYRDTDKINIARKKSEDALHNAFFN
jgi:hypothetical protein